MSSFDGVFQKSFVKKVISTLEEKCNDGVSISQHALAVELGLAQALPKNDEAAAKEVAKSNIPGENIVGAIMKLGLAPEFGTRTGPGGGIFRLSDGDKRVVTSHGGGRPHNTQFAADLVATLDREFAAGKTSMTREDAVKAMGLELSMADVQKVSTAFKAGLVPGYKTVSGSKGGIVRDDAPPAPAAE